MSVYVSKDLLDKSYLPEKYIYSLLFTTHSSLKDNFCDRIINIYCHFGNIFQLFSLPPFLPVVCLTVSAEQKLGLQGLYHQYVKWIFFSPCQAVLLHIRLLSIKANVKYQVPMCNIKNLL